MPSTKSFSNLANLSEETGKIRGFGGIIDFFFASFSSLILFSVQILKHGFFYSYENSNWCGFRKKSHLGPPLLFFV